MGKCNLDQCEDCQDDGACHHLPSGYEQLRAVYYRLAEGQRARVVEAVAEAIELVEGHSSEDYARAATERAEAEAQLQARVAVLSEALDAAEARVVELRVVLAVRDAERDALQARVTVSRSRVHRG